MKTLTVNILQNTAAIALAAIVAVGCASTPKVIPELEAARAELRRATSDPLAQEAAGMRLKKAEVALATAEKSATDRKPLPQIQHQSYLARQNALIAQAQISELRSRKEVEQGEADRNRVLLEARTTEAARAEAAAKAAGADAAAQLAAANAARSDANVARDLAAGAAEEAARLRAELEGLQAKQTDRGMVLTLGDVLFDTNRAEIRPGAMRTVERLAEFLRSRPTISVLIEGHTDSVGDDAYNRDLSQRRADAVREALASRGIAGERVRSRGLGEGYPNASNDNAGGRQQNRRVEVVFSDKDGQFAPSAERMSRM